MYSTLYAYRQCLLSEMTLPPPTREVPSDPRAAVRRLFSQVRVTASIPSFYVADHNQCKNDSRTDTMFVHDYDLQSVDDLRNEVLQTTPERNVK